MFVWFLLVVAVLAAGFAPFRPALAGIGAGGLIVLLLAVPYLRDRWQRWPARADAAARAWLTGGPSLIEIAFLRGGPGRLADLVVHDLLERGELRLNPSGTFSYVQEQPRPQYRPQSRYHRVRGGPVSSGEFLMELSETVLELRRSTVEPSLQFIRWRVGWHHGLRDLWKRLAAAGMLRRRAQLRWVHKGLLVGVAMLAVPLVLALLGHAADAGWWPSGSGLPGWLLLTAGAGAGALAAGGSARALPRLLTGYGRDIRTPAGRRAAELVVDGWAGRAREDRVRVALYGLAEVWLPPGGDGRLAPSRWSDGPLYRPRRLPRTERQRQRDYERRTEAGDGRDWLDLADLGSSWSLQNRRGDGVGDGDGDSDGGDGGGGDGGGGDGG